MTRSKALRHGSNALTRWKQFLLVFVLAALLRKSEGVKKILWSKLQGLTRDLASPSVVRINCGGGAFVDSTHQTWNADNSFAGGKVYTTNAVVSNTNRETLYKTERYGSTFSYSIPLSNGDYVVNLHFAETYHNNIGKRVFDIALQGKSFKKNVDIFAAVGKNSPLVLTASAAVTTGVLSIQLKALKDKAKISAIEVILSSPVETRNGPPVVDAGPNRLVKVIGNTLILAATASDDGLPNPPAKLSYLWTQVAGPGTTIFNSATALRPSATFSQLGTYMLQLTASDGSVTSSDTVVLTVLDATATRPVTRINCGGERFTDPVGNTWQADNSYAGGKTYRTTETIANTPLMQLYQTERSGSIAYNIKMSNGPYTLNIHLAEIYHSTAGKRVFNLSVQGRQVQGNVDIIKAVGKKTPLILSTMVTVSNGQLTIQLKSVKGDAKISGIEVLPISSSPVGQNQAPAVYAGADQEVSVASGCKLAGTVSDDGQPEPANLSYLWTQVSGPGQAIFASSAALSTSATFSKPGSYVLQLAVNDGALSGIDTLAVTVKEVQKTPDSIRINCGGGAFTDSFGLTWSADAGYSGNTGVYAKDAIITRTSNPLLYKSERYGDTFSYKISVPNGVYDIRLHFAELYHKLKGARIFSVSLQGEEVLTDLDLYARWGAAFTAVYFDFQADVRSGEIVIAFKSKVEKAKISGIEITASMDARLHVVIGLPSVIVDYEGAKSVELLLDGVASHTHEPGRTLKSWKWNIDDVNVGEGQKLITPVSLGAHTATLTIGDDNTPPEYLAGSSDFTVSPINSVSGAYVRYYAVVGDMATFVDNLPTYADFEEVRPDLIIPETAQKIGGSPFLTAVLSYTFQMDFGGGTYEFVAPAALNRVYIDGVRAPGAVQIASGKHNVQIIVGVGADFVFPGQIRLKTNGGPVNSVDTVKHDETSLRPFINSMPRYVSTEGGDTVNIKGMGFFPRKAVVVRWGDVELTADKVTVGPNVITLTSPPGQSLVGVTVETPNGASNTVRVFRKDAPPVKFTSEKIADAGWVTRVVWGPDNRIYAASLDGNIYIFTVDDDYVVIKTQVVSTLKNSGSADIAALAFNPMDPPSPIRLYVGHQKYYQNGRDCAPGTSVYMARVVVLEGPEFDKAVTVIDNLPVSHHDHGLNDMLFDDQGDLLVLIGSNTNRGIPACAMGGLPESPLTAALLKADLSSPTYDGNIKYVNIATGKVDMDQSSGGQVDVIMSPDIKVHATGLRNSFCMTMTRDGKMYATDNSGNGGYGPASTSASGQVNIGDEPDKLNYIVQDHYYGHPNRGRGRRDDRQNVFYGIQAASVLGTFTAPIGVFPSSTDGITEYRAMTFGGQLFGHLLVQHWKAEMYDVVLSPDGRSMESATPVNGAPEALTHTTGPGGVIIAADYNQGAVVVSKPKTSTKVMTAYDFHPRRAGPNHQAEFVIGGDLFSKDVRVTVGGLPCEITSTSNTRIKGKLPVPPAPTAALLDIVVQAGSVVSTIPAAFRYILPSGVGQGIWQVETEPPVALQQPVGGVINGVLYIVAANVAETLAYDLASGTWVTTLAKRKLVGAGHSAEVVERNLYLFGGIGGGSEGTVQIYNPALNTWVAGASLPAIHRTSSAATAVIGTKVFVMGGAAGTATVPATWIYDIKNDAWSPGPSMPQGRNNAASGTDGNDVYVFGGRGAAGSTSPSYDTVQIYDATTQKWSTSSDPASGIAPMPQAKSAMGRAIYYKREFYLISGQSDGGVTDRVDVYDPATNTWRREVNLPTPRLGACPLLHGSSIYVVGGGTSGGELQSPIHEVFHR